MTDERLQLIADSLPAEGPDVSDDEKAYMGLGWFPSFYLCWEQDDGEGYWEIEYSSLNQPGYPPNFLIQDKTLDGLLDKAVEHLTAAT